MTIGLLDLIGDLDVRTVLVCGSRNWADRKEINIALVELFDRAGIYGTTKDRHPVTVLHGGVNGADRIAGEYAERLGQPTRAELADWVGKGRAAGPERNRRMLELGPDLVLAFKDDGEWNGLAPGSRGGTEHMCRIAIAAGVLTLRWSHEHRWERLGPEPDPVENYDVQRWPGKENGQWASSTNGKRRAGDYRTATSGRLTQARDFG